MLRRLLPLHDVARAYQVMDTRQAVKVAYPSVSSTARDDEAGEALRHARPAPLTILSSRCVTAVTHRSNRD